MAIADLIEAVERGEWVEGGWTNPLWPQGVPEATARNAYQGDLNAAVALLDAVLPGWDWQVTNLPDARLDPPRELRNLGQIYADSMSSGLPARALLLAILKALAAKETTDD